MHQNWARIVSKSNYIQVLSIELLTLGHSYMTKTTQTHLFLCLIAVISISFATNGFAQTCTANQSIVNASGSFCINYSNSAANVSVTNDGTISQSGFFSNGNAAVRNTGSNFSLNNSGLISGAFYGIYSMGTVASVLNTGSITSTQAGYGVTIVTGGVTSLTNAGTITGVSIFTGFDAYLTTLNNLQGGNASSAATTALRYSETLPTNYNIIIRSPTNYGQLAVSIPAGATTFGIYSGGVSGVPASTLAKGTYASVLTGITSSNLIGATTGNYNGFTWALNNSSGSTWDLVVTGASTVDTQQSLVNTAPALRNAYALQNTVLVNGFSYDCPVFDKNGICLSTGGRYSTTNANSVSTTSALLIGAYRLSKQIRLGAYVDQNLSSSGNTVNLNNSKPMIGLFGIWNEREDGIGAEVKVSAGYGTKDTTITRQSVGTSEAGSGGSTLKTTGAQITAKYNMAAMDKTIVSPYVGIRNTQNRMNSYAEATNSNVTAPLTYTALNTDATTAIAGVGVKYQLDSKMTLLASAGVESDLSNNHGTYSATGITGLTAISFNANPAKTRAIFSAGAHYDIDKHQRISLTGIYREEAYRLVNTTAVLATYSVGL
jgi:hypothetical protein